MSVLPAVATARELAPLLGTTEASLAQDRYHRCGIPYVKYGRRVRYLRADVARYLAAHRTENLQEDGKGENAAE
nr:helix-turn-helix domain-containing protein [Mycobacterium simiae]